MTDKEIYGKLIQHQFEVQAAQAARDKQAMEDQGFFTPDIFFRNNPEGLWAAQELNRYIRKMGYDSEIALDPVESKAHGFCQHLKVGKIPQLFLEDIKDFLSMREVEQNTAPLALWMNENGHMKQTHETTMMMAFQNVKPIRRHGKSGDGSGGIKSDFDPL